MRVYTYLKHKADLPQYDQYEFGGKKYNHLREAKTFMEKVNDELNLRIIRF